jgi:hypothetical protein
MWNWLRIYLEQPSLLNLIFLRFERFELSVAVERVERAQSSTDKVI